MQTATWLFLIFHDAKFFNPSSLALHMSFNGFRVYCRERQGLSMRKMLALYRVKKHRMK